MLEPKIKYWSQRKLIFSVEEKASEMFFWCFESFVSESKAYTIPETKIALYNIRIRFSYPFPSFWKTFNFSSKESEKNGIKDKTAIAKGKKCKNEYFLFWFWLVKAEVYKYKNGPCTKGIGSSKPNKRGNEAKSFL